MELFSYVDAMLEVLGEVLGLVCQGLSADILGIHNDVIGTSSQFRMYLQFECFSLLNDSSIK